MSFRKTKAFDIAALIRVFRYDANNDKLINTTTSSNLAVVEEVTRNDTNEFVLDTFSIQSVLAAKYVVSMTKDNKDQTKEILVSQNGLTAKMVEYAEIGSDQLASFTVELDVDNNVNLKCTPTETGVQIKYQRNTVDV